MSSLVKLGLLFTSLLTPAPSKGNPINGWQQLSSHWYLGPNVNNPTGRSQSSTYVPVVNANPYLYPYISYDPYRDYINSGARFSRRQGSQQARPWYRTYFHHPRPDDEELDRTLFEGNIGVVGLPAVPQLGQVFGEVGFGRHLGNKFYVDENGEAGDYITPINDIFYSGTGGGRPPYIGDKSVNRPPYDGGSSSWFNSNKEQPAVTTTTTTTPRITTKTPLTTTTTRKTTTTKPTITTTRSTTTTTRETTTTPRTTSTTIQTTIKPIVTVTEDSFFEEDDNDDDDDWELDDADDASDDDEDDDAKNSFGLEDDSEEDSEEEGSGALNWDEEDW